MGVQISADTFLQTSHMNKLFIENNHKNIILYVNIEYSFVCIPFETSVKI